MTPLLNFKVYTTSEYCDMGIEWVLIWSRCSAFGLGTVKFNLEALVSFGYISQLYSRQPISNLPFPRSPAGQNNKNMDA